MKIGMDIGSTTIKCVVLDDANTIIYHSYERHCSQIIEKMGELLLKIRNDIIKGKDVKVTVSGSAEMGIAQECNLPFIQEVYATRLAAMHLISDVDVIIELGGEDAKILFLSHGVEVRMNGSCAGGTGAFIDQMANLLNITPDEMNEEAKKYEKIYTVASRCGVFAKSDVQPLVNQGAKKSDIAASIFAAVANQTIAGMAQGRPIEGKVLYLGGPLTFLSELRKSFDKILNLEGICPGNSLYFVSLGAAFESSVLIDLDIALENIKNYSSNRFLSIPALFEKKSDYEAFVKRHEQTKIHRGNIDEYQSDAFIGIDAGSTTIKAAVISVDGKLLHSIYQNNSGNPVPIMKDFLIELYTKYPQIHIKASAVTGYGEELLKNAFSLNYGIVETAAHLIAAKQFKSDVDFVIDIGGQDMKCFKIRNGLADNIFLNEACSSGCGSFLQTFSNALGYEIPEFAKLGLFAKHPVDLGSRCTVFMNSSIKQAQKDGASTEDISAGLSVSVVKNAIYKVIRASSAKELGKNIIVQGGTFLNDAVLRVFEKEMGVDVIRPDISGMMGAFGAAIYAREKGVNEKKASLISLEELQDFKYEVKVTNCELCSNHCPLTINIFSQNRRFVGGNRCEKPIQKNIVTDIPDMYEYKLETLLSYKGVKGLRGKIGFPMTLNFYEMLPFWYAFFTDLGFEIVLSPLSNRNLYIQGQHTIPSDTVCYPAKLVHGHICSLLKDGIDTIFYPCMSYNFDEGISDNHYNCPVVAYYPEVISANVKEIEGKIFIHDYVRVDKPKNFSVKMHGVLSKYFDSISLREVIKAAKAAYKEYDNYLEKIRSQGNEMLEKAERENLPIIILAGRPYHLDPEVNHGINKLITSLGVAVISEEIVSDKVPKFRTTVLNQWTYHARLYAAAKYISIHKEKNMNLVQLVSFGCGVDAITTDEVRSILEEDGKIYTQIKIDEITNLGAVKIRLRSLFAALNH